ncbi:MAG: rhombotarget lipoprotein [Woeseiaceae bacterium]|nr:rhombotarget lipoprotein [Woeseiaceae bacterium]
MANNKILTALLLVVFLSGCTTFFGPYGTGTRVGASSSLVDYLYPDGQQPPAQSETVPQLDLPLRVGIAFVPGGRGAIQPSEAVRMQALENVRAQFLARDYVEHIEIIPDAYLRSTKGITGMQQLARLYGVDVMALVSYDQVAVTTDTRAALLYWTIVGAYTIEGTNNSVQTFVDTAVFDVDSAQLLFRAPGIDERSERSTAIDTSETAFEQNRASFDAAMGAMTENLETELSGFETRIQNNPELVRVSYSEGYGGGGALDGLFLLLLIGVAIGGISWRPAQGRRR